MAKMNGFQVVLLAVSLVKCYAMSKSEIEDFSDFLKRTSALDQSLKDGVHSHDEDELVSDHAWEESGKFEGDLILNERQRRLIVEDVAEGLSRNGLKDSTKRWPNNEVVVYIQREHFSSDQVNAILEGIQDLARASCVKFRPYKKGDRDAVVVQGSRRGCFSQVGYQGGYQVLNLSARHPVGRGCFRHGTVVHELLHTLGFYHMQSSPDRDDYINVLWENIVEPAKHNFRKYNTFSVSDFGVGYDYDSVLHYSKRAFSSNGKPTLVPKQNGASIGQRIGLSDKDTQKLNKMYCDADSNNFDQDEPSRKPTIIKKKPKNQPFQGHGIGYHQGKTVLIKLPTAEAVKLPEGPTYPYHTFDYFSKTSHAVPSTLAAFQGFRAGKEMIYKTPSTITAPFYDKPDATSNKFSPEKIYSSTHKDKETNNNKNESRDKSDAIEETKDNSGNMEDDLKESNVSDPTLEQDLEEAFERLRKIVTARVYPSQSTKSKTHKDDTANSKYYNPNREFENQMMKLVDDFSSNSSTKPKKIIETKDDHRKDSEERFNKENNGKNSDIEFGKPTLHHKVSYENQMMKLDDFSSNNPTKSKTIIETKDDYRKDSEEKLNKENNGKNIDIEFGKPTLQHKISYDSSYGTALPFKRLLQKDLQFNSQYKIPSDLVKLKDIKNKHDYSSLYNPDKKLSESESEEEEELYTLLGSPVPFKEPWYKVDEIDSKLQYSSGRPTDKNKIKEDSSEYEKSLKRLMKLQDYTSLYNPTNKHNNNNAKLMLSEPRIHTSKDWYKQINTGPKTHQYKSKSNENLSEDEKQGVADRASTSYENFSNESPDNSDENEYSRYSEKTDRPKLQSYFGKPDKKYLFRHDDVIQKPIEKDPEEEYDHSEEESSSEKNKDTTSKSGKTPRHRVKEENNEQRDSSKSRHKYQNKILSDDSSFDGSIDDRLSDILNSYTKYDDFDIASYAGHNESSEEEGNQQGSTKYSNYDY